MAGQDGGGYAIGVDVGTSNTVAVLRWPDGRTRALLFDGQPIMPSGVFLDQAGRLHVGRDAQRLAQADPARFEPNPKRRVDENAVLLGDREVPTVDLFAAVLRTVAGAAVEAVGFLPPAVITYPAGWGARRRDVLVTAVGRAGWPPVNATGRPDVAPSSGTVLVPEPVAAARYFVDVLRRPVPVGASLAVFDFGGGTLDVAVVRNEGVDQRGRARFQVIGTGGLVELGGLDLDAALVEHLAGPVATAAPDAWRQLSQPAGAIQWRNRRQFWEDVRGAKEMLSRAAAAPIPVPGVDRALHLTREELEQVAAPLLRRAVFEAAAVIANCKLAPHQLAGLFLVGGSSRVPLVARMLHTELGIAPTVLEQPELPVAEGALAEAAPAAPGSGTHPHGASAMAGRADPVLTTSGHALPTPPGSAPPGSAQPVSPGSGPPGLAGRRGRTAIWVVAAAVVALVGVATAAVLYLNRDGYDDLEFRSFVDIGRVEYRVDAPSYLHTAVLGNRAYVAVELPDSKKLAVAAVEAGSAKELWRVEVPASSDRWSHLTATPNAVLAFADAIGTDTPREMTVLDPGDGRRLWSLSMRGNDEVRVFDEVLVFVDRTANRLAGRDLRDGDEEWTLPFPTGEYGAIDTAVHTVTTAADLGGPGDFNGLPLAPVRDDDQRIVQIGADRSARVIDVTSGAVVKSRTNVADPGDLVLAHEDRLYAAVAEGGYWLAEYDLASMGEPRNVYRAPDERRRVGGLVPCGQRQVCLLESAGLDGATTELVAVNAEEQGARWRRPAPDAQLLMPVGDHVLAGTTLSEYRFTVFRPDGGELLSRDGMAARVDGGNLLAFAERPSTYADDASVAGVRVSSAEPVELGQLKGVRAANCSWNAAVIVCPAESDFVVRRFAEP
nr:Hsp70 family protein [Micromonospora sp. DSM 115978]